MTPAEPQAKRIDTSTIATVPVSSFGKKKFSAAAPAKLHLIAPAPTGEPQVKASEQQNNRVFEPLQAATLPPYLNQSLEIIWQTLRQTVDARQLARLGV